MNFQFCILGFRYYDSDRMNHTLWAIRYGSYHMSHMVCVIIPKSQNAKLKIHSSFVF